MMQSGAREEREKVRVSTHLYCVPIPKDTGEQEHSLHTCLQS